ncbi:unnamed protein product [Kuraishia capsulata CBS 1993]|uniref:Asparagine--tRNA ligase, mitochondrial n=1 Tax=Kuraishia capsulata CBS 1993 TaxID=1382522 RepID=W6MHC5_9ASCO|nr:uncharacterized protein KUCA_T00001020001 [Kuraishia capsulata CBS 1993]CDK25053.1 unnamed protein product [Kuraishia capsulata CBS 1993]
MLVTRPSFRGVGLFATANFRSLSTVPASILDVFKYPPPLSSRLSVRGWVTAVRAQKKIAFVQLTDGTTSQTLQCILDPSLVKGLKTGVSVELEGSWSESKGNGAYELKVGPEDTVKILGDISETYPLQKKFHSSQFLRTIPEFRYKTNTLGALMRLRSNVDFSLNQFFNTSGFYKTNPPLVTSSDCEGAGELFTIESNSRQKGDTAFFGKKAYLTVSTQLHLEVLCMALSKVWTLSPCFRAEESDTNRHLSEFWMMEVEIAFVEDVHQLTKFTEEMIKATVRPLLEDHNGIGTDIKDSKRDPEVAKEMELRWKQLLAKEDWDCITYTKAIEILAGAQRDGTVKFEYEPVWGDSLQSEHEKWLAKEYFKGPVFVTDYPKEQKPFYMLLNSDNKTVACYDLLVPEIGELVGGSLREHDLKKLQNEIERRGMNAEEIEWYVKLRESGSVPHGGFGMGFERLLCYLGNVDNIRDAIPFPRAVDSCVC